MKILLLLVSASFSLTQFATAQTAPSASAAPPATNGSGSVSKSWLASRGVLSVADLSALTGVPFSPAERARLEPVVAARNAELERLNAQLSGQLSQILREGDAQIATRVETQAARSADEEFLERLKRRQPSRYQELMRRKRAQAKEAGK